MNRESVFERKQAGTLVLAAFLTDSFIQPFGRQTEVLPARTAILAGALQFALLCAVMAVYLRWCGSEKPGPVRSLLLCGALVLSIALEVIQGERFYNYVMQQQLAALLFLILVFGAAYYGAFAGVQALGRAAWPVLALAAASVLVLGWSVAGQMQFSHLQTPVTSAGTSLAKLALTRFYLPPELLLLPFLCPKGGSGKGAAENHRSDIPGKQPVGPAGRDDSGHGVYQRKPACLHHRAAGRPVGVPPAGRTACGSMAAAVPH